MTNLTMQGGDQSRIGRSLDLLAFCLVPCLVAIQGHRFGLGNHDTLLSFLRHRIDHSYLSADWMLSTPPVHPQLMTLLVSPLVAWLGENGAFLALHLATRWLLLAGTWRLAMALFPGRTLVAALAMVATLAEPRLAFGAHYLQGGHWEPAFLGMAGAVWSLALGVGYLQRSVHWTTLALALGLTVLVHLFIGGPILMVVLAASLMGRRDRETIWWLLGALFIGSISWVPAAQGFFFPSDQGGLSGAGIIQLLQFRHPHHHQPWLWPVADLLQASLIVIGGAWLARGLFPREAKRMALLLTVWFVLSCVAFVVFGRLQMVPMVAYLQPFRLFPLLWLTATIAVIAAAGAATRGLPLLLRIGVALALVVGLRMDGIFAPALLVGWAILLARIPVVPSLTTLPRWPIVAIGFVGAALLAALQTSEPLRAAANRLRGNHWLVAVESPDPERRRLADWVRGNTSPMALFAIPPAMEGFRIWERRAIVVDFKNVPYRAADLREWAERVALGANVDPFAPFTAPTTADAPPQQLVLLATSHGARYVVIRDRINSLATVYQSDAYSVLDLDRLTEIDLRGIPMEPVE